MRISDFGKVLEVVFDIENQKKLFTSGETIIERHIIDILEVQFGTNRYRKYSIMAL